MGLGDYLFIKKLCLEQRLLLRDSFSAFDFGCASGRVLRHFAVNELALSLYVADINKNNVAWVRKYLPHSIRIFQNTVLPNLPIGDCSIDLVFGLSVFTHIHEYEEAWLLELSRILKKGGLAFCTIHTERTWKQITEAHFIYTYLTSRLHVVECASTVRDKDLSEILSRP